MISIQIFFALSVTSAIIFTLIKRYYLKEKINVVGRICISLGSSIALLVSLVIILATLNIIELDPESINRVSLGALITIVACAWYFYVTMDRNIE